MKFKILLFIILLSLSGCQKGCSKLNKNLQMSARSYQIKQYSGGKCIAEYNFNGILNDSEGSDGYYFFKGDTLVEVSGDLIIKSVD